MKFCGNCGARCDDDARVCGECGHAFENAVGQGEISSAETAEENAAPAARKIAWDVAYPARLPGLAKFRWIIYNVAILVLGVLMAICGGMGKMTLRVPIGQFAVGTARQYNVISVDVSQSVWKAFAALPALDRYDYDRVDRDDYVGTEMSEISNIIYEDLYDGESYYGASPKLDNKTLRKLSKDLSHRNMFVSEFMGYNYQMAIAVALYAIMCVLLAVTGAVLSIMSIVRLVRRRAPTVGKEIVLPIIFTTIAMSILSAMGIGAAEIMTTLVVLEVLFAAGIAVCEQLSVGECVPKKTIGAGISAALSIMAVMFLAFLTVGAPFKRYVPSKIEYSPYNNYYMLYADALLSLRLGVLGFGILTYSFALAVFARSFAYLNHRKTKPITAHAVTAVVFAFISVIVCYFVYARTVKGYNIATGKCVFSIIALIMMIGTLIAAILMPAVKKLRVVDESGEVVLKDEAEGDDEEE